MVDLSSIFEPVYTLSTFPSSPKHFIVIGAGGTGGYLIPNLARLISILSKDLRTPHQLTIIDGDKVEFSNLSRQNFYEADVGHNKAVVMASRCSRAFGLNVGVVDQYLDSFGMLADIAHSYFDLTPVFIGCVDNNKTRMIIHDVFKSIHMSFYVDAGNEEWAGQVVCGFNYDREVNPDYHDPQFFRLPCVVDIFPDIRNAQDKLPTEISCGERAASAPQNIYTNQSAANIIMGFCNTILTSYNGLKYHAVTFNAQNSTFHTRLNYLKYLKVGRNED